MYTGQFLSIKDASTETGLSVTELIEEGFRGGLNIYAWEDWFHFGMEFPFNKYSVDLPILLDDEKHLALLKNGKAITLHIDADGRFICRQDATDDNELAGVKITQDILYCLKSDIEQLKQSRTKVKSDIKSEGQAKNESEVEESCNKKRNEQRNEITQEWLETEKINPDELIAMENKEILDRLKLFSPNNKRLFTTGGNDWLNRDHSVIPKRQPGRRPSK